MSMIIPKRSASEMDLYEDKPSVTTSDDDSDAYRPTKRGPNTKTKTKTNNEKKMKAKSTEDKSVKRAWTAEEDRIFIHLMSDLVKSKMWDVVKEDGRLGYRGNPGIRAHAIALVSL